MPGGAPKKVPDEIVAFIKEIINIDRRERQMAGFIQGTTHLVDRIAAHFGLSVDYVKDIKKLKERRYVRASLLLANDWYTVPLEKLERIRQRRIRKGFIEGPWKPVYTYGRPGTGSFKQRLRRRAKRSKGALRRLPPKQQH